MRLNRGTLALIVVLLVALVVILVVNQSQLSAPGTATSTPSTVTGALLPNVAADSIVRYEIRDNNTGQFTALTKDTGGAWQIDGTNVLLGRDPDQNLIGTTAGQIVAINYSNTFEGDELTSFGLDHPLYTVLVLTSDGTLYTIYIGAKSPTSARYYAVVESVTGQTVPQTSDGASATESVVGENANEEGGADVALSTNEAAAPTAVPEATAEATTDAESAGSAKRILRQATEEPTAEVTPDASAQDVDNVSSQADNGAAVTVEPAPTVEVTFDPSSFTPMPTAEATAEVTLEATANLIQAPQVTLSGTQTVYLIPQTVLDTLKNWLAIPPYAPIPTGVPTDEAATPDVSAEATDEAIGVQGTVQPTVVQMEGADTNLIPEGTPFATGAPSDATPEATAEATAAQ